MHRLPDTIDTPAQLSQAVVQVGELLGLYRAEVARVLGFKCESISALYEGRLLLNGGDAAENGRQFIRLFNALYDAFAGDGPRMVHWLRANNRELGNSPFLLLVDEGEVARLADYLEARSDERRRF